MSSGTAMVSFDATASIKRTDFGIKTYLPMVADEVKLHIVAEAVQGGRQRAERQLVAA